jgi:drug/metabolite transporter (DMT)-like permease
MLRNWKSSSTLALTALVGITAVWGSTFIVVQNAISRMPVMDFLAVRFTLAAIVMFLVKPKCLGGINRKGLRRGLIAGLLLGLGYVFQTFGLQYTSATVSGFITGMFVVLTPIGAWIFLRHKTNRNSWIAVVLALTGLALLSLKGWSIGLGELLTLGCAVFVALHIIALGEWASQENVYTFTLIQIFTIGIISLAIAAPGGITLPPDLGVWGAIGLTAILATAAAFLVQVWAQALVPPTRAAVVMTMEPVFAGLFGVLIGGNQLTLRILIGSSLVLAGMVIVQLNPFPQSQTKFSQNAENKNVQKIKRDD